MYNIAMASQKIFDCVFLIFEKIHTLCKSNSYTPWIGTNLNTVIMS